MKKLITIYFTGNKWEWCLYDGFKPFSVTLMTTEDDAIKTVLNHNQRL